MPSTEKTIVTLRVVLTECSMSNQNLLRHMCTIACKAFGQCLCDINGTVLAACTANRDGQVAAVVLFKTWQPAGDELFDVINHQLGVGLRLEKYLDGFIQPCEWAQVDVVKGVGQAADIKNEIGIHWDPVFKTERFEQNSHAVVAQCQ